MLHQPVDDLHVTLTRSEVKGSGAIEVAVIDVQFLARHLNRGMRNGEVGIIMFHARTHARTHARITYTHAWLQLLLML